MMNAAYIEGLTSAEGIRYGRLPVPGPESARCWSGSPR